MSRAGTQTVLIVDDEKSISSAICSHLALEGVPAVEAGNGREALEYLLAHPSPAAIVLDLMMPVMSGWELLSHLQSHPTLARIPVIVTSAVSHEPDGVAACIAKPIDPDELLRCLRELCSRAA